MFPPPPHPQNFSLSPLPFSKRKALGTSFLQPFWSKVGKYFSPPRRLPLGIPMKIAIIEKQLAANDGKREKAGASPSSLFSLPIVPQALSFSFFPVSPQHKVDCEQSLFFFRFSKGSARLRERRSRETRETRASCLAFCSTDYRKKRDCS